MPFNPSETNITGFSTTNTTSIDLSLVQQRSDSRRKEIGGSKEEFQAQVDAVSQEMQRRASSLSSGLPDVPKALSAIASQLRDLMNYFEAFTRFPAAGAQEVDPDAQLKSQSAARLDEIIARNIDKISSENPKGIEAFKQGCLQAINEGNGDQVSYVLDHIKRVDMVPYRPGLVSGYVPEDNSLKLIFDDKAKNPIADAFHHEAIHAIQNWSRSVVAISDLIACHSNLDKLQEECESALKKGIYSTRLKRLAHEYRFRKDKSYVAHVLTGKKWLKKTHIVKDNIEYEIQRDGNSVRLEPVRIKRGNNEYVDMTQEEKEICLVAMEIKSAAETFKGQHGDLKKPVQFPSGITLDKIQGTEVFKYIGPFYAELLSKITEPQAYLATKAPRKILKELCPNLSHNFVTDILRKQDDYSKAPQTQDQMQEIIAQELRDQSSDIVLNKMSGSDSNLITKSAAKKLRSQGIAVDPDKIIPDPPLEKHKPKSSPQEVSSESFNAKRDQRDL